MKGNRIHIILQVLIVLMTVWLINQLADRYPVRFDLTEEQRYTISEPTKTLLRSLDEELFFEVYLAGELPPGFNRFQRSIREMLEQFSITSRNQVQFKFTDPAQAGSAKARNEFFQSLINRGLQPTNLNYSKDGDKLEKLIFPGVIISKGVNELPVNLLKGNSTAGPEAVLNQSAEGLEYELASAIVQLLDGRTRRIGYLTGHGSPDSLQVAGLKNTILSRFELYDVSLANRLDLKGYDAMIIGKPTSAFSEREKYLLDQYLMRGGSLVFFIDALRVNMDSASGEGTVAIPYEVNLADQLFKYGVRINQNFVLDINSGQFPVVAGNFGDQPQVQMIPWPFFPIVTQFSGHPSVRNLDAILMRFVSTIDTVKAPGIRKVPLLSTSPYTKVLSPPVRVAFNDLRDELIPERFNNGVKNVGYLLEGEFTSLYANRLIPRGFDKDQFISTGAPGKVIVISDGDLIRNDLDPESGQPLGLGVEPFTKSTYANEAFVLNILDYLTDDSGLIEARSRQVRIRPLDRVKVKQERLQWQIVNLGLPLVLVLFIGVIKWYIRKRTHTS